MGNKWEREHPMDRYSRMGVFPNDCGKDNNLYICDGRWTNVKTALETLDKLFLQIILGKNLKKG